MRIVRFMGQGPWYTHLINNKEVFSMKTIKAIVKNRKHLSFQTVQCFYGVSILLTFLAAGRLGA